MLVGIVGYTVAGRLAREHLMARLFGEAAWAGMSGDRQHRAVLYVLSTVNAAALTAIGLKNMAEIYRSSPPKRPDELVLEYLNRLSQTSMEREEHVVEGYGALNLMSGYMLHDFLSTIHEWARYKDQWFHHVFSLGLLGSIFQFARIPQARQYVGLGNSIVIMDASTVFLNLCWFLRESGRSNTRFYRFCLAMFVSLFFALRCVLIPNLVFNLIYKLPHVSEPLFGGVKPLLAGAVGLQFYWAWHILKGLASRKLA